MPISQYYFSQSLLVKEAPVDVFQFQVIYKYNASVRKIPLPILGERQTPKKCFI